MLPPGPTPLECRIAWILPGPLPVSAFALLHLVKLFV